MRKLINKEIDRSDWLKGVWDNEADNYYFIDAMSGYKCYIVRVPWSGHLCGYVAVPKGHEAYGVDYDDELLENIEVHGGLTYSDKYNPYKKIDEDSFYLLGFDCGHFNDIKPYKDFFKVNRAIYRDVQYVTRELRSLCEQLNSFISDLEKRNATTNMGLTQLHNKEQEKDNTQ